MYEQINYIIRTIKERGYISIEQSSPLFKTALFLHSDNILLRNKNSFSFDKAGVRISELGSYEKYLIELDEQKQQQKRLYETEIKSFEATVDAAQSAKTSKKWGIIGVSVSSILAFFSLILNIYQFRDSAIKDDSLKEINKKLKQQDSLLLIQQKLQPKIDSLLYQKPLKK